MPWVEPVYDFWFSDCRTCTALRGFAWKSYHSSVRVHVVGRCEVDGCDLVLVDDRRLLDGGVRLEVRAHQLPVPVPAVTAVGGGVDAHEAAAGLDVALEGGLLVRRAHRVAGGRVEDDGLVLRQVGVSEQGAVLGHVDREVVLGAELLDGRDAVRNRVMPETRRLGEDEDLELRSAAALAGAAEKARTGMGSMRAADATATVRRSEIFLLERQDLGELRPTFENVVTWGIPFLTGDVRQSARRRAGATCYMGCAVLQWLEGATSRLVGPAPSVRRQPGAGSVIMVGWSMSRLTTTLAAPRAAAPKPRSEATNRHWLADRATTSRSSSACACGSSQGRAWRSSRRRR